MVLTFTFENTFEKFLLPPPHQKLPGFVPVFGQREFVLRNKVNEVAARINAIGGLRIRGAPQLSSLRTCRASGHDHLVKTL